MCPQKNCSRPSLSSPPRHPSSIPPLTLLEAPAAPASRLTCSASPSKTVTRSSCWTCTSAEGPRFGGGRTRRAKARFNAHSARPGRGDVRVSMTPTRQRSTSRAPPACGCMLALSRHDPHTTSPRRDQVNAAATPNPPRLQSCFNAPTATPRDEAPTPSTEGENPASRAMRWRGIEEPTRCDALHRKHILQRRRPRHHCSNRGARPRSQSAF